MLKNVLLIDIVHSINKKSLIFSGGMTGVDRETEGEAEEVDPGTADVRKRTRINSKAACQRGWPFNRSQMKSKF